MTCILDETIRKLAEATRENPHLARANFLTVRDIADAALEAQTTDLLDALKQAEPILDAASATAREDGGTMIPGARPAWDAVRAAIERITP